MPDPTLARDLPEIRLAGFLNSGLGLGETARRIVRSLQAADVAAQTHAWEKTDEATVPFETSGLAAAPSTTGGPGLGLRDNSDLVLWP